MTPELSAWCAATGLPVMAQNAALATDGRLVSLGGRRLFGKGAFGDG